MRRQRRALTPEESDRVMRVATTRRNAPRWRIAPHSGSGRRSALGLQVEDIDVEERVLYVWRVRAGRVRWFHGCCADPAGLLPPAHRQAGQGVRLPAAVFGPSGPGSDGGIQVRWTSPASRARTAQFPAMLDESLDHVERLKKDREAIGGQREARAGCGMTAWRRLAVLLTRAAGYIGTSARTTRSGRRSCRLAGVARRRLHSARNTAVSGLDEFGFWTLGALLRTFGWSSQSMKDHYRDLMPADPSRDRRRDGGRGCLPACGKPDRLRRGMIHPAGRGPALTSCRNCMAASSRARRQSDHEGTGPDRPSPRTAAERQ